MGTKSRGKGKPAKEKTPTFLLELPLVVEARQAAHLRAHPQAGGSSTTPYSPQGSAACARCEQTQPGGRPAPSPGL